MRFVGTIQSRSSKIQGVGPPGESEIQELNPTRCTTILEITGWSNLEPGSLNLGVSDDVLIGLDQLEPSWVEDCSTVIYPKPYEYIPAKRVAYHYYLGVVKKLDLTQPILARRAKVPVPGRVEILAPVKLRDFLSLADGDTLDIELCESNKALH